MRKFSLFVVALGATTLLVPAEGQAQDYYETSAPYYDSSYQLFSMEELDNLLAPVALYPDPILADLLIASTYADQVDLAARHVRVFGTSSIDYQPWDLSVKAVAYYPPVLNMLADRQDWTAALGQAYAVQPSDVMESVQRLRNMARHQGNLISTPQHTVIVERQIIRIVPAHPRVIYVPVYDPRIIYHRRGIFHASVRTAHFSFGIAFPIGSWLSYDCDWLGRRVYYDGWRGHGWRQASRPHINIVNVYVNPRYETVNINTTIINRTVNHVNLRTHNTIHTNVKYDGYSRNITKVVEAERSTGRGVARPRYAQEQQQGRLESQVPQRGQPQIQPQGQAQPQIMQRTNPGAAKAPPHQGTQQRSLPQVQQRGQPQVQPQGRGQPQVVQRTNPEAAKAQQQQQGTQQRSLPQVQQRGQPQGQVQQRVPPQPPAQGRGQPQVMQRTNPGAVKAQPQQGAQQQQRALPQVVPQRTYPGAAKAQPQVQRSAPQNGGAVRGTQPVQRQPPAPAAAARKPAAQQPPPAATRQASPGNSQAGGQGAGRGKGKGGGE